MMDEMLHPGKVGVAFRWHPILPANVIIFAESVRIIKRRIRQNVVSAKIRMQVASKRIRVLGAKVRFDTSQSKIHHRQATRGRVAFLSVNTDVAQFATMGFNEFL
jgi:hypothetical protein